MNETGNNKKQKRGMLLTIAVNLLIVGYIAVREFRADAGGAQKIAVLSIKAGYLLLGVACFLVALAIEYLKYRDMMMAAAGHDDRRGAFTCAVLGKYYDNITPLGAGGQPFQILYLKRRGLPGGASAALPVAGFLVLQLAFILIAAVVFLCNRSVINGAPVIRVSAYVGLVMYAIVPAGIVFFAVLPNTVRRVVDAATRLLGRLRVVRDSARVSASVLAALDAYTVSLRVLNRRPHFFARLLAYSVVYQAAILSVPYFMLRAFGGTNDWWTVFSLVVYIYAAITIIPTPGNAGAAEGSFYAVFSSLEGGFLFWAMIVWRLLVYYSWLLLGLVVVARSAVSDGRRKKRPVPDAGPLRVALFSDRFYPSIDGVVRTVDAYARQIIQSGSYACVVCPRQRGDDAVHTPYDVIRTPSLRLPGLADAIALPFLPRRARRLFREKPFDVFHAHSPFLAGDLALFLGRRLNVPVVATFHSKFYDDALNITHSKFLANMLVNRVVNFYCKVDAVWACSKSTAETLRGYGFNGEITVMENGVEPFSPDHSDGLRQRAAAQFRVPAGRHVVLFVGQLIWQKNLRLVLDVTKRLAETRPDCVTIIAGSGYNSAEIQSYAAKLCLDEHVRFTGEVHDRRLLYGLYLLSEVFFFPSVYDNAPLVLREAALAELPALLTEGSNAAEIVRDGYNGYTAPETCAAMTRRIEEILADAHRAQVGAAARATIPVSWEQIVKQAMAAYRII